MNATLDFHLRSWQTDDIDALVSFANNPRIASRLTDQFPHPYRREDGIQFLNICHQHDPMQILAIDIGGMASGAIGIHPQSDIHRLNAELGYWLAEPFWGKGIMTVAIQQMVRYAFSHFPVERIFARPFGSNIASQRVLQKAGFVLEARFQNTLIKNGVYEDELVYGIRKIMVENSTHS